MNNFNYRIPSIFVVASLAVVSLIVMLLTTSCRPHAKIETGEPTKITGRITGAEYDEIIFNVMKEYTLAWDKEEYKAKVNEDGSFAIDIDAYTMAPTTVSLGNTSNIANIYLIPGDELDIEIVFKKADEGTQEAEQEESEPQVSFKGEMADVQRFFTGLKEKFPYDEDYYKYFYNSYDYKAAKNYWNSRRDSQLVYFDELFKNSTLPLQVMREAKNEIIYEWAENRTYYLLYHYFWKVNDHEPIELDGNDYDYLKEIAINNPLSKSSQSYLQFLTYYQQLINWRATSKWEEYPGYEKALNAFVELANAELNGLSRDVVLAAKFSDDLKNYGDPDKIKLIKKHIDEFGKMVEYPEFYDMTLDLYAERMVLMPGKPAFNFTIQDFEGNDVSLSDFAGKVVYLDIWSLGCGPCLKEIPFAKKLHKEFENQDDMVFLSISLDNRYKDHAYKYIKKKEMPGVHLLASLKKDKELRKEYMYSGIPYYALIGRDGNFIEPDMTRPSNEKTKQKLIDALKR